MGIIASVILIVSYHTINKKREKKLANGEAAHISPEELSEMGDRAVTFRYMF